MSRPLVPAVEPDAVADVEPEEAEPEADASEEPVAVDYDKVIARLSKRVRRSEE